jgi:hypothetical protein
MVNLAVKALVISGMHSGLSSGLNTWGKLQVILHVNTRYSNLADDIKRLDNIFYNEHFTVFIQVLLTK